MPWNETLDDHPFAERLAEVLDREPSYYQLLISTQPTRRMSDVIDSLALEGDPDDPQTVLSLFQELAKDLDEANINRWLARLRHVAQQAYGAADSDGSPAVTDKLLRLIYADPRMYELVAATEPGYGLLEIVESLALEMNVTEVETGITLMSQLSELPDALNQGTVPLINSVKNN
jgi:hypothetical protein